MNSMGTSHNNTLHLTHTIIIHYTSSDLIIIHYTFLIS